MGGMELICRIAYEEEPEEGSFSEEEPDTEEVDI